MIEVQGQHVSTAIQSLVREQLDEIASQFVMFASKVSEGDLEKFGIYPDQQSFRSAVRRLGIGIRRHLRLDLGEVFPGIASNHLAQERVLAVLDQRRRPFTFGEVAIPDASIVDIETWAHRERNQLSFINAFTALTMYKEPINAIRTTEVDLSNLKTLQADVDKLNSQVLSDIAGMNHWLETLVSMFRRYSIVEDHVTERRYGQVRRRSERIYLSAWSDFVSKNMDEIWKRSKEIAKDPEKKAFYSLRRSNAANMWRLSNQVRSQAPAQRNTTPRFREPGIVFELSNANRSAESAKQTWASIGLAKADAEKWLTALVGLYGDGKGEWVLRINVAGEPDSRTISVIAATLPELVSKASKSLEILGEF